MKKIISAREQFDNDVKNAKYADEVCSYNYYYEEDDEKAVFYFVNDSEKDYCRSIVPKFQDVKSQYGLMLASYFAEHEINSWKELQWLSNMSVEELCDNQKMFTTYCDFLFQNCGDIAIEGHCYKDKEIEVKEPKVVGAECTDVNAISSMVEFLKSQLISKIEGAFESLGEAAVDIKPLFVRWTQNASYTCTNTNGELWIEGTRDGKAYKKYPVSHLTIDELINLYSQLRK